LAALVGLRCLTTVCKVSTVQAAYGPRSFLLPFLPYANLLVHTVALNITYST
jgi:hypothetical protein